MTDRMSDRQKADLDNYITGHYGEDQLREAFGTHKVDAEGNCTKCGMLAVDPNEECPALDDPSGDNVLGCYNNDPTDQDGLILARKTLAAISKQWQDKHLPGDFFLLPIDINELIAILDYCIER